MQLLDQGHYCWHAISRHRIRTAMLLLAVTIGVASVLLLTSLGEGARRFINNEFSSLGSQMLIILPGRKETTGATPPIFGTTPRDLTLEDAQSLQIIPSIKDIAPVIAGTALISAGSRSREVITLGTTQAMFDIRQLVVGQGIPLPDTADNNATPVCVLGSRLAKALFGNQSSLGQWLRMGEHRFRVIGVLAHRGESLGLDLRDMAMIPVRSAESLFNSPGLFRIIVQLNTTSDERYTKHRIRRILSQRHEGEDDFTLISQDSIVSGLNKIITAVTASIGAIAAISLFVAGILIMNVSYISVSQRREEIGLLKALGASSHEIRQIFITEAMILVGLGTLIGSLSAYALIMLSHRLFPQMPIAIPWWSTVMAVATAMIVGIVFSWLPAADAAKTDPIIALRGQR